MSVLIIDGHQQAFKRLQRKHSALQADLKAKEVQLELERSMLGQMHSEEIEQLKARVGKLMRENLELQARAIEQEKELEKRRRQCDVLVEKLNETQKKLRALEKGDL